MDRAQLLYRHPAEARVDELFQILEDHPDRAVFVEHIYAGRYQLGGGVAALPSDHELFGLDPANWVNRRMTFNTAQ